MKTHMHKRFSNLLSAFVNQNEFDPADVAWMLSCTPKTVQRWMAGEGFASRDSAVKLMRVDDRFRVFFNDDRFRVFFNELARADVAVSRFALGKVRRRAA